MNWVRRWSPWVAALSLVVNLLLLWGLWQREAYINRYLWGGTTMRLMYGLVQLDTDQDPEGLIALELLDAIQYLPRYQRRFDSGDHRVIQRFLREAAQVKSMAIAEFRQNGMISAETKESLTPINQGLTLMLDRLHQVNELEKESYTFNHAAWRSMWHGIASEVQRVSRPS